MSIRNREDIPQIFSETHVSTCNPYTVFETIFDDAEYFCVSFMTANELSVVKNYIPDNILDEIRHKELHLLLSNNLEGFFDIALHVSKFAEEMNLPKHKITLLTAAYDVVSSDIKTIVTDVHEFIQLCKPRHKLSKPTKYKKRFICPNRRWRLHRPALVALLASRNVLQYGYVSLRKRGEYSSWESCHDSIVSKYPELKNVDMLSIPDLFIDEAEFNAGMPDELSTSFYEQSCFSVTSETNFYYPESRVLTEKTCRNIDYKIPFILVGRPHSLSLLRDKGYKTFSPFINEDYDLEEDDDKRLVMIADEIERLCNLPEQELLGITEQLKPICEYNHQVLLNRKYPDDFVWCNQKDSNL